MDNSNVETLASTGSDDDALSQEPGSTPQWLQQAREELASDGDYLAFEEADGERITVITLEPGWTHLGRSMKAEVRLADPTVSRRHALIHSDEGCIRLLDDHSLNGVLVNGERVEWHELADGDEIRIGAFRLHYIGAVTALTGGRR